MEENTIEFQAATPAGQAELLCKDDCYSCTNCNSPIEIISLNQDNNTINFKCVKNKDHGNKTLSLKDYLEKMTKNTYLYYNCSECGLSQNNYDTIFSYCINCNKILCNQCKNKHNKIFYSHQFINTKEINNKCLLHNSVQIISYCLDCNCQLCEKCLDSRKHLGHRKNLIREVKPKEEEIKIVEKMISKYIDEKLNLENEEKNYEKILKEELIKSTTENEEKYLKNIEEIKQCKEKELEQNNINYTNEINDIENQYNTQLQQILKEKESKISELEKKYNKSKSIIIAKYLTKETVNKKSYEEQKELLEKEYKDTLKDLEFKEKISNIENIININTKIYKSYKAFSDNYYNCININKILLNYYNNDENYLKEILKENFDDTVELILQRDVEDKKYLKKESEMNQLKIENEIINLILDNIRSKFNYNELQINSFNKKISENTNINNLKEIKLSDKKLGNVVLYYLIKINLAELEVLWIDGNQISNLENLNNLNCQQLKALNLNKNNISDISILSELKFYILKELDLSKNNITDINPLTKVNFQQLNFLNLSHNKIKNIELLAKFKFEELKELEISNNNISNINILSKVNFPKLNYLNLGENQIEDISVLSEVKFKELLKLELSNNIISDISVLSKVDFPKLILLNLGKNQISDINILSEVKFKDLKELYLFNNNISDISCLEKVPFINIQTLKLSYNKITDISIFSKTKFKLKKLYLHNNKIDNLDVLIENNIRFDDIESLHLDRNNIDREKYENYINNLKIYISNFSV